MEASEKLKKYEKLKEQHYAITQRVSVLDGQRQEKEKQLGAILARFGVKTVAELTAKVEKAQTELDVQMLEAAAYVETTGKALADLDSVLVTT